SHPQRAWSQDGRERCHVDRGLAGARVDPQQLRTTTAHPGATGPDADSQADRARDVAAHATDPEDLGGRQPEVSERSDRHPRNERRQDADRDHRRGIRSRDPREPSDWDSSEEERGADRGAAGANHESPPWLATVAPWIDWRPRGRAPGGGRRRGKSTGTG